MPFKAIKANGPSVEQSSRSKQICNNQSERRNLNSWPKFDCSITTRQSIFLAKDKIKRRVPVYLPIVILPPQFHPLEDSPTEPFGR